MKTTMRTATAAAAMAIFLAACGGSPTAGTEAKPAGPSYDGGYIIGTGNRETPPDSTPTAGEPTGPGTTTTQGGYIIGTGN